MSRLFSRRELLWLFGTAGTCWLLGDATGAIDPLTPAKNAVDHLVLAAGDLDQGIAWVEKQTGVKAVFGGVHPGRGTRNALLSLGNMQYLEILAPDPAQKIDPMTSAMPGGSKDGTPRLILWAAATTDIERVAKMTREAGKKIMGPMEGSRSRPDGKILKWKILILSDLPAAGAEPIPFFIQWDSDSIHPSVDSPKGCELAGFEIEHPEPQAVSSTLRTLGIDAEVKPGKEPKLRAILTTPKGRVELE